MNRMVMAEQAGFYFGLFVGVRSIPVRDSVVISLPVLHAFARVFFFTSAILSMSPG
jgi:hypothetical protein